MIWEPRATPPSHPDLLDYLAVELMDNRWSLKHLHRLIVSSATYQQSSRLTPELEQRDPYNRLLARGSRFRVPAETVRDITLAASGLLNRSWADRAFTRRRRSSCLRPLSATAPKSGMSKATTSGIAEPCTRSDFAACPTRCWKTLTRPREICPASNASTSNTPMQALTSLNEPMFIECSIALAAKTIKENPDAGDTECLSFAMRRCVQRSPTADERDVLLEYLGRQRARIESGELSAASILSAGAVLDLGGLNAEDLAAWSLVCRVLLNLDESITRE